MLTEPWVETAFAHVPIICTIKGEPYPCNFEPNGLGVIEYLNKTRHVARRGAARQHTHMHTHTQSAPTQKATRPSPHTANKITARAFPDPWPCASAEGADALVLCQPARVFVAAVQLEAALTEAPPPRRPAG